MVVIDLLLHGLRFAGNSLIIEGGGDLKYNKEILQFKKMKNILKEKINWPGSENWAFGISRQLAYVGSLHAVPELFSIESTRKDAPADGRCRLVFHSTSSPG